MKIQLHKAVGSHVRLVNVTDVNGDSGKVRIHCHGKLEYGDGEYYVRVGEDPQGHGTNGVGFCERNVDEVYRQPSGIIEITLKG